MNIEDAICQLEDLKDEYDDFPDDKEALIIAIEALKREQQLLDAGYRNETVNFYIRGRLFRAKEIAQ